MRVEKEQLEKMAETFVRTTIKVAAKQLEGEDLTRFAAIYCGIFVTDFFTRMLGRTRKDGRVISTNDVLKAYDDFAQAIRNDLEVNLNFTPEQIAMIANADDYNDN